MSDRKIVPGLVTIAIPAYKRKWLNEAIESALAQNYKDIELIIVDDHSPQNLKDIVEPYLSDGRVSYYYNEFLYQCLYLVAHGLLIYYQIS